ncbi:hypothetical protein NQ117_09565 [Paenibacillus sp. SC116]|uniref:hypothetical protein n=1 Tax=Paenibacillus sp. SC116 TaxID=2968986 RepID=UPI00215A1A22|nr:hypothetical protein [Paenibacillus sp. SC116]MCR8843935.1 hypothetical protein [Paenibacillus sp. SC116]
MSKKMIIKGVGKLLAKKRNADGTEVEVITLGTLQSLRFDFNVEIEDIFGGDSLFAIDTLVRSKSISCTATDAKFDLNAMRLMMGSNVSASQNTYLWALDEQKMLAAGDLDPAATTPVKIASATVDRGDSLYGDGNLSVRLKDNNLLLTKVNFDATKAPTEKEFMVETKTVGAVKTTRIILNEKHANKDIVFNYQYETSDVDVLDILSNEVPFPVTVVHHGSFLQKDNTYAGVETELFSCVATGQFSIDTERTSAASSTISLKIIDPERADGKIGTIKRYTATTI